MPGRTITGWFRPTRVGTYDIQCTQMCGIGHALMAGRIVVETQQDHAAWLMRSSNPSMVTAPSPPVSGAGNSMVAEAMR
jgi:cytochrome c oxidase subunit 2